MQILNAGDHAFQRIAIIGFKSGTAEQRITAVQNFEIAGFGRDVQVHVTNKEKGPRGKRELTEACSMTFADSTARDNALKLLEAKYPKLETYGVAVNIMDTALVAARARTKVQKSCTWALRKAFDLIKKLNCKPWVEGGI